MNEEKDEFEIKTIKEEDLKKIDKQVKQEEKQTEISDILRAGGHIYDSLIDIKSTLNSTNYSMVNIGRATDSAVVELRGIDNKFKELNSILRDIRDEFHVFNILACKDMLTLKDQTVCKMLLKELEERIIRYKKDNKNK